MISPARRNVSEMFGRRSKLETLCPGLGAVDQSGNLVYFMDFRRVKKEDIISEIEMLSRANEPAEIAFKVFLKYCTLLDQRSRYPMTQLALQRNFSPFSCRNAALCESLRIYRLIDLIQMYQAFLYKMGNDEERVVRILKEVFNIDICDHPLAFSYQVFGGIVQNKVIEDSSPYTNNDLRPPHDSIRITGFALTDHFRFLSLTSLCMVLLKPLDYEEELQSEEGEKSFQSTFDIIHVKKSLDKRRGQKSLCCIIS